MALTEYVIEKQFTVSPARLFRAFTQADDLRHWVWGPGVQDFRAAIDLRINGTFDISIDVRDREGWGGERAGMRGIYLVVEPDRRLIHTLHWDAPVGYNAPGMHPLDEVLVLDFLPEGDGTLLRYRHMGIPDDGKSVKAHEAGVRETLNLLQTHLSGQAAHRTP